MSRSRLVLVVIDTFGAESSKVCSSRVAWAGREKRNVVVSLTKRSGFSQAPNSPRLWYMCPVDGKLAMAGVRSRRVPTIILRRVLIIDDNTALAENIAEILQMAGHATQVAASAEEAFPKARENEPDVVVADFRLPGMSGALFVRQFRATRIHIRAMVISADTDDATIDEATGAGAEFMPKPLDLTRLNDWVGDASA